MIENINVIDILDRQIMALLELMMMADKSTDIQSMNTAAEMCMTMQMELKVEVDKMYKKWQEANPLSSARELKELKEMEEGLNE